MIDTNSAIDLIEQGLKISGYNIIPNLKSFKVKDLFEIYSKKFNLKYSIGNPRISEKIHEVMISKEEMPRTKFIKDSNVYYMHYKNITSTPIREEFTSDKVVVSKKELESILESYNYFKF